MTIFSPYRVSSIVPGIAGFNGLTVERFDFTIAQITALNSTPIIVLPGITGYAIIPEWALFLRNGTQFATQPGALQIRVNVAGNTVWTTFGTTVLTTSGITRNANWGNQVVANIAAGDDANGISGKTIDLFCATGDPTIDGNNPGSNCTLIMCYKVIPTYIENWLYQSQS